MKKIHIILFTVLLAMVIVSCTPQSLSDQNPILQACCGDDGEITPPPPPPPNGGN
ncbi:hypothetical protein NA63_2601 [Flavobacteriaceae bacterium MAR_2010_105]|nr:hypothetical protein NA63_2601 [Flavobacteriaceae bacterium MAR_2010_105]